MVMFGGNCSFLCLVLNFFQCEFTVPWIILWCGLNVVVSLIFLFGGGVGCSSWSLLSVGVFGFRFLSLCLTSLWRAMVRLE